MARPCPPTLALPSAFVSDAKWAGKIPNISLESSSQTAGTITEKAAAPGTEAYETHHTCVWSARITISVGRSNGPLSGKPLKQRRLAGHDRRARRVEHHPNQRVVAHQADGVE